MSKQGLTISLDWEWTEKQWVALNEPCRYLLWGGSKGAGKSVLLCRWAALHCLNIKNNRGFMGRQRSVDFYNTTLETFRKFVDPRIYNINEQRKRIYFPSTGSEIFFGGMDDQESIAKFNSAEFGFVGIDQAEEVDQDTFALLCGTLRFVTKDGIRPPYQIRMTANPAQCWLVNRFIQSPEPEYKFIPALPIDNPFLPAEYIPNLKRAFQHRPELVQAYVYGNWDIMAGADIVIKPSWVRQAVDRTLVNPSKKRLVSCDPARFGDDETVIYVMEGPKIIDQMIYGQKDTMYTVGQLAILQKKYNAKYVIIDKGNFGGGIYDRLVEMKVPTIGIDFGGKASTEELETRYKNRRAEMYWEAADSFANGDVTIINDQKLINQLSDIKYKPSEGKILIEPKDDIKTRHSGESPDRADAYVMGLHGLKFIPDEATDFKRNFRVVSPQRGNYGWSQEVQYV